MDSDSPLIQKIEALAAEIRSVDQSFAERLSDIAQQLTSPQPGIIQVSVDDLLTDEADLRWQEVMQRQKSVWLPVLLQMRTLLFILPVLFTWLHLATSLSAYNALAKSAPDLASEPFLVLWQTGFAGSSPTGWLAGVHAFFRILGVQLTFSSLAIVDVILILLVIVGSLWIGYQSEKISAVARDSASRLRDKAQMIVYEIRKHVAALQEEQRKDEERQGHQTTARLVAALQTHVESIKGLEKYLQSEQKRLENLEAVREAENETRKQLVDFNKNGIGKLVNSINRVETFSQNMGKMGENLTLGTKEILRVQNDLTELISQSHTKLIDAIQTLDGHIQHNSQIGEDTIGTVNHTLDRLHAVATHIQSVVEAQKLWRDLSHNMRVVAEQFGGDSEKYSAALVQSIHGQTETLDQQMQALNSTFQALASQLAPIAGMLTNLPNNQERLITRHTQILADQNRTLHSAIQSLPPQLVPIAGTLAELQHGQERLINLTQARSQPSDGYTGSMSDNTAPATNGFRRTIHPQEPNPSQSPTTQTDPTKFEDGFSQLVPAPTLPPTADTRFVPAMTPVAAEIQEVSQMDRPAGGSPDA